jgi:hypothetical protein
MSLKKITIITSVYSADKLINNFLEHITGLNGFKLCTLLLYDIVESHSSGEYIDSMISMYRLKYDNIEHIKIEKDPGLYGIWNMGVKKSETEYITNANLDDFRHPYYFIIGLYVLEKYNVDLYSSNYFITKELPTKWTNYGRNIKPKYPPIKSYYLYEYRDMFDMKEGLTYDKKCFPHCAPIWKRKLHVVDNKICILFDEDRYGACADYEFWIRASKYHKSKFIMDYQPLVLYYEGANNYGVVGKIKDTNLEKEILTSLVYNRFINKNMNKYNSNSKLKNMAVHYYLNLKIIGRYINI